MPPAEPTAAAAAGPRLYRLPGRTSLVRWRMVSPDCRLWLGQDQLVQDRVWRYTQEIQRFALNDIQALQVRRTSRGVVYNIVLGVLMLLCAFGAWGARDFNTGLGIAAASLLPLLVLLVVNLVRGATCRTTLTTLLGAQPLPSLSRLRSTLRALALITAQIDTVQGALLPEVAAQEVDRTQARHFNHPRPAAPTPGANYHY